MVPEGRKFCTEELTSRTTLESQGRLVSIPLEPKRDKSEDRITPKRPGLHTPGRRPFANPLFVQRMSGSGHSSDSDSPPLRRITSAVSNPDDKGTKYLVRTPKVLDNDSDPAWLSKNVLRELSKEAHDGNRAPSPRPLDVVQLCVEHNKQLNVWEDFMALSNGIYESDVAPVSFRRTKTLSAPECMPKALKPQSSEELDYDDDSF
ncbi:hypothetical protein BWQ96_02682 [Gracilariopsis chorda]|uniref:Uncharacterized protein n=1 Tax=Gracilariopsis chorda TaxID=448386 RepID=A0A2V3IZH1_9FLOR|nr:hypothetical protein BWQ96_02682 [Gracilariopsis chorda]|eukprot:PXF47538.1 hypothetical protein BWQ96_02682 [Gracilariopsis chorda]